MKFVLSVIGGGGGLNLTPKVQAAKAKINNWDYTELKTFCTAKKIAHRVKRQSTKWEEIFTNHLRDKR